MSQHLKNILIVVHHYPPHITGVGMVAYNQAKHLVSLGYKVTIVTSSTAENEKSSIVDGVNVIRINALNFTETKWGSPFPIFSPRVITTLIRTVKEADVVHVHDAFYISSFVGTLCAWWYKKPVVLTQHVAMIAHPSKIVMAIEKIVYATTGALICYLSNSICLYNDRVREFILEKGVSKSKIKLMLNSVDTELFHPVNEEEKNLQKVKFGLNLEKKAVLFVGRLVPKKGFDKLLQAKSPLYQLVFAGCDCVNRNDKDLVFLGKFSQKELAGVYQAADIFVLPSESEGFPLSVQEAMASGLPVITTDDEGYESYGLDKNMICLIKNPTSGAIRDAIVRILGDDSLLKSMSNYSRKYALEKFSSKSVVNKLSELYGEIKSFKKE